MDEPIDVTELTRSWLQVLRDAGISDLPASGRELPGTFVASTSDGAGAQAPGSADGETDPANSNLQPGDVVQEAGPSQVHQQGRLTVADHAGYPAPLPEAERRAELQQLEQTVAGCQRCEELVRCRTQTVFGIGNPNPRLVFFGEAPGADEDRLGEPFVGRAGELLNRILGACKMQREDVYILNTIKCRPPGNRNPADDEIANCRVYFERQLDLLQPEFICCLGAVASRTLLDSTESISRLRGKFHSWKSSRVIVTYHPAYLLRTPAAKAKTWEDMKMLMREMGVNL